ncbi:MAG: class I adenylate-forming enzyme family protein [Candidatus Acidiferrum sp.]
MIEEQVPEILSALPKRISDAITPWHERFPDRPALVESSGAWSYRQLSSAIGAARKWLVESGVRPGDRVMLVCENCRAFVGILLGLASFDAWPVLVNARLSAQEIDQIRDHSGARRIIYTVSVSPHAREHAKRHGASSHEVPEIGLIATSPLNEDSKVEPVEADGRDSVAALIYTSGTTGKPKGVMLTHQGLLFVAAVSARIRSLTPEDSLLGVLPMSHAVGLSVVLLGGLLSGASLHLAPRFDPVAVLSSLENGRLTVMLGAPAMFGLFVDYTKMKGLRSRSFPALRIIASAGAPLTASIKSEVEGLFGLTLHNGYGVTECSPTIAQTRVELPRADLSIGKVFPGVEVKLIGPDGSSVPEGQVGELCTRGPNMMKGYYRAPEETAAAIDPEGWYNTHDLARFEDGNLFIVGRSKELIVRFGFNVYPAEVEATISTHSAVARCAVVGRPAEGEGGEEVVAFVELLKGVKVTAPELADYATEKLAPYKRPSQIFFVDVMPMTPTGKIRKEELAERAIAR